MENLKIEILDPLVVDFNQQQTIKDGFWSSLLKIEKSENPYPKPIRKFNKIAM